MNKERKAEYFLKLTARLNNILQKVESLDGKFSYYRFIVFGFGVTATLTAFYLISDLLSLLSLILFSLIFGIVAHFHSRLKDKIKRLKKWIKIKESHRARIDLKWNEIPLPNETEKDINPIERDLNLVGEKSLLHLVSTCTTMEGTNTLRKLLLITEPVFDDIKWRQRLVKELKSQYRFRDKLLLESSGRVSDNKDGNTIKVWLKYKKSLSSLKKLFFSLTFFSLLNILLFTGYHLDLIANYWMYSVMLYLGVYYLLSRKISSSYKDADLLKKEIGRYSVVLDFIENYKYREDSELKRFVSNITESDDRPSRLFNSVKNYLEILSLRANPFLWFFIILIIPLDYYLGMKIEFKKQKIAENFDLWLKTWHELEAYNSLANFAYLNPEYIFPELNTYEDKNNLVWAEGIGHPLIPEKVKIRNDFSITNTRDICIFTGSNMSGKSTFLRTIGLNILLAFSGAPVDSKSFSLHLMKLFTCINVTDSVIDGISYFYAEVKRLKELMVLLGSNNDLPVFFLIDEIFKGTNNIERLKGSQAYVKQLLQKNVAGIIATHDLELTNLSKQSDKIFNYHFREEVVDNKMVFDYKLRSGPCPTTNALKIMAMEGLPVNN